MPGITLLFFLFSQVNIFFSSDTNIKDIVIHRIREAKREIILSFNSFSDREIAKELSEAKERRIKVSLLLGGREATSEYSVGNYLALKNIDVYYDTSLSGFFQGLIMIDEEQTLFFPCDINIISAPANFYLLEVISPQVAKELKGNFQRVLTEAKKEKVIKLSIRKENIVYITPKGKKYHREGCRFLKKEKKSLSKKEAEEKGYKPCLVCKP